MSDEKRSARTNPNLDYIQGGKTYQRIPAHPEHTKDDVTFKVTSSSTIGALENQLNELAAQEFFPEKILVTSKDQFITVFAKVTEQEAPSPEELNELLGTEGVSVGGATREASNT